MIESVWRGILKYRVEMKTCVEPSFFLGVELEINLPS